MDIMGELNRSVRETCDTHLHFHSDGQRRRHVRSQRFGQQQFRQVHRARSEK